MNSKNIYEDFCDLMKQQDNLFVDLCDALDGPVDLEEILGYAPDWDGLTAKENKLKERLKLIIEKWDELMELKNES